MNATPNDSSAVTVHPPQIIQSLVSGFNIVANNIYLILLPILLDLLLWFGPHLRVKTLLQPAVQDMMELMRTTGSIEMRPMLDSLETIWKLFLDQYNVFSALSTFPVGTPSLLAGQFPIRTPLGIPQLVEVNSLGQFVLTWFGLTLIGFILGSFYFSIIAHQVTNLPVSIFRLKADGEPEPVMTAAVPPSVYSLKNLFWETLQALALILLLVLILMVLGIPTVLLTSFVAIISPVVAQIILLLISFSLIWFLIPLVFAPFGIFLYHQNLFQAVMNSIRVVRYVLPGTGFFLLIAIVIYQGLGMLWRTAPDNSWMVLIGIFGNAFISTGLLAGSFIFYRNGLTYVQNLRNIVLKKT